jgi:uncharacterized protein YuzE
MRKSYLEVTYRKGKPFAAYLYLERRAGDKAARTERHGDMLIDITTDGRTIGVEFTRVGLVDLSKLDDILRELHQPVLDATDVAPLVSA